MKKLILVLCIFCFLHPTKAMSRFDAIEYKSLKREENQILRRIGKLGRMMTVCGDSATQSDKACRSKQDGIRARYIAFEDMLEEVRMELEEFEE